MGGLYSKAGEWNEVMTGNSPGSPDSEDTQKFTNNELAKRRILQVDPRSVSDDVTRTPIQVDKISLESTPKTKAPAFWDPRSPSNEPGLTRTPIVLSQARAPLNLDQDSYDDSKEDIIAAAPPSRGAVADLKDIEELVQLVSRMDDWKDLCRYSGKSISMASTKYGNEMKIHVMAFAERDDATGVDFMRVSYKKSVEVQRSPIFDIDSQSGWSSTLRMVLPFLWSPTHTDADKAKEQWVQLLQRPDVAKFTIALAFRAALANDGVLLKFCEADFNDAADL